MSTESTENQINGTASIYQQSKMLVKKYLQEYLEEYLSEGGQIAHFEEIKDDIMITQEQTKEFITFMKKKSTRPSINVEADPNTKFFIHKDQKAFDVEFFAKNSNGIVGLINKTN